MKAFAKLNLQLYIINKREDGYHNLQMVNTRINLFDEIRIKENKNKDEVIYINQPNLSFGDQDIILKVLKAFKEKFNITTNYTVLINKNIPIGAGLGGASMDVAEIIKYLIKRNKIVIDNNMLTKFLKEYGADIPYGIYMSPCVVEGIGEKITKVKIRSKKFILINPCIAVSTKQIFSKCDIINIEKAHKLLIDDCNKNYYHNDLENVVVKEYPELFELKQNLIKYGQSFMTGSGSCFVLLPKENIGYIYNELKRIYPNYKIMIIKTKK